MTSSLSPSFKCHVCGRHFDRQHVSPWASVRPGISTLIAAEAPGWQDGKMICHDDLSRFRNAYVTDLLEQESGELREIDRQVVESLATGAFVTQYPDDIEDSRESFGEIAADRVAAFGGSWTFILSFCIVLLVWMIANTSHLLVKPFDPYPFILLNLVLSSIAAIQAPVIMMSQKRQETKDRRRAENDYRVNLKAELEIRQLHEKIDHQIARQWEKLVELQQLQIEMLDERNARE